MNDHDIESAVTAGLQAANDHAALDAEWLRKFTCGVLAHASRPVFGRCPTCATLGYNHDGSCNG